MEESPTGRMSICAAEPKRRAGRLGLWMPAKPSTPWRPLNTESGRLRKPGPKTAASMVQGRCVNSPVSDARSLPRFGAVAQHRSVRVCLSWMPSRRVHRRRLDVLVRPLFHTGGLVIRRVVQVSVVGVWLALERRPSCSNGSCDPCLAVNHEAVGIAVRRFGRVGAWRASPFPSHWLSREGHQVDVWASGVHGDAKGVRCRHRPLGAGGRAVERKAKSLASAVPVPGQRVRCAFLHFERVRGRERIGPGAGCAAAQATQEGSGWAIDG